MPTSALNAEPKTLSTFQGGYFFARTYHHLPTSSMPSLVNPPRLHPPHSLNEQLVLLSQFCNSAAADASPQALLLASTVRKHVVTPLRIHIFQNQISNQLDQQLDTVTTLQSIFKVFLTSDKTPSLSVIYRILDQAIAPLPHNLTRDILTNIWNDLHTLLAPHVTEWISRGLVHDSTNFFIIPHPEHLFTVDQQNLPPFITLEAAHAILEAGLARRAIATIAPEKQSSYIPVTLPPPCTTISMVAASNRWRHDAVNHLSNVLPFDQLRDKLVIIRDQLLQGDSLYWRTFFDQLRRHRLQLRTDNDDHKARVERALNAVLTAISDGNPPFVFILRGGVLPSIPLSFVEQQLLQKRIHVFTDLFSMTFNARRASENSSFAFVHLNALHRELRSLDNGLMDSMALRSRMEYVVQAYENYVHMGILQPTFSRVLDDLNADETTHRGYPEEARFDTITNVFNKGLDLIQEKCFLHQRQVRARFTAIFGLSLAFSDYIASLTADELQEGSVQDRVKYFAVEFDRNSLLLFQLLSLSHREKPDINLSLFLGTLASACGQKLSE